MFLQLVMALSVLENRNEVHGDLHLGNILYREEPENNGKYLYYMKDGKHCYIRHTGRLYCLWDFSEMRKNGEIDRHSIKAENTLESDMKTFMSQKLAPNIKLQNSYKNICKKICEMLNIIVQQYNPEYKTKNENILSITHLLSLDVSEEISHEYQMVIISDEKLKDVDEMLVNQYPYHI
jgi:hypothetical protein